MKISAELIRESRSVHAAVGLRRSRAELREAYDVLDQDLPPWYRLGSVRAYRRAGAVGWVAVLRARARIRQHELALEHLGAGAEPDEWGVFSVAPGLSLESTLRKLVAGRHEAPGLSVTALRTLAEIPPARAAAVLGDRLPRAEVERAVSALAVMAPDKIARNIWDHLPDRARGKA